MNRLPDVRREGSEGVTCPLTWYLLHERLQTNRDMNTAITAGKSIKEELKCAATR